MFEVKKFIFLVVVEFFRKNFKKFSVLYLRKHGKFSFQVVMLDNQMIFLKFF